jgi:hypothetical protein
MGLGQCSFEVATRCRPITDEKSVVSKNAHPERNVRWIVKLLGRIDSPKRIAAAFF